MSPDAIWESQYPILEREVFSFKNLIFNQYNHGISQENRYFFDEISFIKSITVSIILFHMTILPCLKGIFMLECLY